MRKYQSPEIIVTNYIVSKDIAAGFGSNIWYDDEDENGNPIEK